ncbi:thioesterase family protein [Kocuria palustris]|uniref:acyl-CoA thioesterase n=1 Tax=Kocuria palustris TaxID=71999 RepID=UPI0011A39FD0|nr:thioesterase family protein [Kocuria palustris]
MNTLTIPIQMRFGDIDSFGHANNVMQLQYFEDARIRLGEMTLEDAPGVPAGTTYREMVGDRLTVIGRQEVEYLQQMNYRTDPVEVEVWASHISKSSYVLNYRLQEQGGGTVFAIAQSTTVEVDAETGRPEPLGDEQRAFLEHFSGEPTAFKRRPSGTEGDEEG